MIFFRKLAISRVILAARVSHHSALLHVLRSLLSNSYYCYRTEIIFSDVRHFATGNTALSRSACPRYSKGERTVLVECVVNCRVMR